MSIKLDKFYNMFNSDFETKERLIKAYILNEIKYRQDRLAEKEKQIKNLTYEKDLIEEDILHSIRNELNDSSWNIFRGLDPSLLLKAWRWGNHYKEDKYWNDLVEDEKEAKEYKDDYKKVADALEEWVKDKERGNSNE